MRKFKFDFKELETQFTATLHGGKLEKWNKIGANDRYCILQLVNAWNYYGMREYHDAGTGFVFVWWMLDQENPTFWLSDLRCLDYESIYYMIHCDENQHYI